MTEQQSNSMPPAATPGTPEADRVRSYLQAQAARLPLPHLVEKVRTDMQQVKESLHAVPEARYTLRPAENDWSANEVANHLVQTSRGVALGITMVLDSGATPGEITDLIDSSHETHSPGEWWRILETDREEILQRVSKASGEEHLDVLWPHRVFGDLNWREWLLFMRVHDLDHARQLLAVADEVNA